MKKFTPNYPSKENLTNDSKKDKDEKPKTTTDTVQKRPLSFTMPKQVPRFPASRSNDPVPEKRQKPIPPSPEVKFVRERFAIEL